MHSFIRYTVVSLASIDIEDSKYFLCPSGIETRDNRLQQSIQRFGLLHPPLLQKATDNRYRIVSGRKRIICAGNSGIKEITALVIDNTIEELYLWEALIQHAQMGKRFSIIEQAVLLKKVSTLVGKEEALTLLPLLGHKAQPYMFTLLTELLLLDSAAVTALHNGTISIKTAGKLNKLSQVDQQEVLKTITIFNLGGSKQQKFLALAIELQKRTKQPLSLILDVWKQNNTENEKNIPQRVASLLQWMHEQCSPRSVAEEKNFSVFKRSLNLPKNMSIDHTSSFEDDGCTLFITFADKEAAKDKIQHICNLFSDT